MRDDAAGVRGTIEDSDEIEEAGLGPGELVISNGDAREVFDLDEEASDQIAFFVDGSREAAPCSGGVSARDDRVRAAAVMASARCPP